MRRLALPLAAALAAALCAAAPAAADPEPGSVVPDKDPFYAAPADLAGYAPGQIVASRKITPKLLGVKLDKFTAWQISYRTNDSHDQAELTVTTLLVPTKAWTGTGPRPIVSYQAPEDSTGTQCAPSYSLASGTNPATLADAVLAAPLIDRNWAVAVPDFEGPKSVFMAGLQAGHAVLDGIRAVRNFTGAPGIGAANPWALTGYSGGAQATGWAAELHPAYAPELGIVGASMGGTPADPAAVARSLDGGPFSGFEFAAAASLAAEFPEAGIDGLLNDRGRTDLAGARGKCLPELLLGFPFRKLSDSTTVPDPLSVPSVAAVLKRNTLGAAAPAVPIYNFHAIIDEIVPVGQADTLVKTWCARGAKVQTVRDLIGEHALTGFLRGASSLDYLTARFAGKPAPSTC